MEIRRRISKLDKSKLGYEPKYETEIRVMENVVVRLCKGIKITIETEDGKKLAVIDENGIKIVRE